MTVVSQIITDAYRESNNIAVGQSPSYAEQQEGLLLFNRFLRSVLGTEVGELFQDFSFGNTNIQSPYNTNLTSVPNQWWTPEGSSRLFFNNSAAQSLYLNPVPKDGDRLVVKDMSNNFATYPVTINGNGRLVNNSVSIVLNTSGQSVEYLYRADTGNWAPISDLTLSDTFPFPEEFEDFFSLGVAIRINPRGGASLDQQSVETFKRLRTMFKARYRTSLEVSSELGLCRLTSRNHTVLSPSKGQNFLLGITL